MDLVPPNDPIPDYPGRRHGGMQWYLRSYTRSPIKVEYPKSERPMRVVYWGRWANATGETGPFSKTCEGPVVGWSNAGALEDKRKGSRVVVSLRRRALPLLEEAEESKLLEYDAKVDQPRALPDAA